MQSVADTTSLVPLIKVVNASIIDNWEDIGKTQQRRTHWAARGLKKLYEELLPKVRHKALLTVNKNTFTATLPSDFDKELFVGGIDSKWRKVPFKLNTKLVDSKNINDVPCEDKCEKCQQDKSICNDLVVTEETNLIIINDNTYEQTTLKKLYPNGDYYLETSTPVLNINTYAVDFNVTKEFIVNFDLKPCGCLETTPENIVTIQTYCPDIYCNYYSACGTCATDTWASYNIFEETGLIQLSKDFPFDKLYIEYNGFIKKIAGQYMVPQVAFETLVEYVKFMSIDGNKSVSNADKQWRWQRYVTEKGNMNIVLSRFSLQKIMQAIEILPKFDTQYTNCDWYECFTAPAATTTTGSGAISTTIITNPTTIINRTAFVLALKVDGNPGSPVNGVSTYQNNLLKGAIDLEYLFLAKQVLTRVDGDFTFNSATGQISIAPNVFVTGDSLIMNYNKNV